VDELNQPLNGRQIAESGIGGDTHVPADLLLPLVYEELRRLAAQKMARESPGQTLEATALVHEAWMRIGGADQSWENRAHFYGAAAEAMRRILIDAARRKQTSKHRGELQRIDLDNIEIEAPIPNEKLLELHDALDLLADHDPRKAQLVKLRYFTGLSIEEAAEMLGIGTATAKRDWAYSRAWLMRRIREREGDPSANSDQHDR
jgi:RNA polymerase sigma factor (TIGR02999 family)